MFGAGIKEDACFCTLINVIQAQYNGTRIHSVKLFKPTFESKLRTHAFSQRIIDDWNSLKL